MFKSSRWRRRLLNGLALLFVAGASLAFLEVLIRLATTHSLAPLGTFPNTLYEFDPRVGVLHRADGRFTVRQRDFRAVIETNAQGFRSSSDFAPPTDRPVIAMLGDSMTQALQVDERETFVHRLGERLPAVVQNYGVSGHGTANSLAVYRHFARPNRPAVVVLTVVQNDPRNCSPELEGTFAVSWKPAYHFDEAGQPIALLDFEVPDRQMLAGLKGTGAGARIYHFLHEFKAQWATLNLLATIRGQRAAAGQGFPADWLILETPWRPELARAVALLRWCLLQLAAEVEADGAVFVLAHVPAAVEADDDAWASAQARYSATHTATLDRRRVADLVADLAAEAGVPFADCYAALQAAARAGEAPWLPIDGHLTPAGHAVVADQLTPVLQAALDRAASSSKE